MPELMTLAAAAELLKVGRSTIVHLAERGDLVLYYVPTAKGGRLDRYVDRAIVERMAADGSWRRRPSRP